MSQQKNVQQTAELVSLVGQVGCVIGLAALVIIGAAFGIGWWIDNLLGNERKIFTILLMLGSFPISLYAMIKISLYTAARANAKTEGLKAKSEAQNEENNDV